MNKASTTKGNPECTDDDNNNSTRQHRALTVCFATPTQPATQSGFFAQLRRSSRASKSFSAPVVCTTATSATPTGTSASVATTPTPAKSPTEEPRDAEESSSSSAQLQRHTSLQFFPPRPSSAPHKPPPKPPPLTSEQNLSCESSPPTSDPENIKPQSPIPWNISEPLDPLTMQKLSHLELLTETIPTFPEIQDTPPTQQPSEPQPENRLETQSTPISLTDTPLFSRSEPLITSPASPPQSPRTAPPSPSATPPPPGQLSIADIKRRRMSSVVTIDVTAQDFDASAARFNSSSLDEYLMVVTMSFNMAKMRFVKLSDIFPQGYNVMPLEINENFMNTKSMASILPKEKVSIQNVKVSLIAAGQTPLCQDLSTLMPVLSFTWNIPNATSTVAVRSWSFTTSNSGAWIAIPDQGTPGTSHRKIPESLFTHDLLNCYSTIIGDQVLIRSGIIDTAQKVRQFGAVLQALVPTSSSVIRVCSMSLVATSAWNLAETSMAKNQHGLLEGATWSTRNIELLHMNLQGCKSDFFGIKLGEQESRAMNETAARMYSKWMIEELLCLGTVVPPADSCTSLISAWKLKLPIPVVLSHLLEIQKANDAAAPYDQQLKISVVLKLLIAFVSSLETGKMTTVQRLMAVTTINSLLKVVTAMNCKSGCDRTSISFAVATAINMILITRPDPETLSLLADVILNYETMEPPELKGLYNEDALNLMLDDPSMSKKMLLMLEFRNCFFANLIEVGWTITILSTGVPGLKIGRSGSLFANPVVRSLVPPYTKVGNHLTTINDACDLLVGLAHLRGGKPASVVEPQHKKV
ncbi:hypothetical protein Pelo_3347 [Pelomyxa schiedti]|nr:hypothetical protein Pelo_3347 [Pelomyxa schiedti]